MSPHPLFVAPLRTCLIAAAAVTLSTAAEPPAPITTAAEAFARWPTLTVDDVPVLIEGVVTGTMPTGAFRLHDGELGLYVSKSDAGQHLTPGDRVRVAGLLRQGGFSPWILPHTLTPLGRGVFPEPRRASYSTLASGTADNQWLEIEGVVRAVEVSESREFVVLDLGMSGGNLRVLVNYTAHPEFSTLVDAEVRMRGVAAVNVNKHGHVVEPTFRVPSFTEITVTRPAPPDAFSQALVPIAGMMRPTPGRWQRHRVRIRGVVTRRISDTTFFLREGQLGLKVETRQSVALRPGDVIETTGFPTMTDGLAVLQYAAVRKTGSEAAPAPARPTVTSLLEGSHNSDLVTLQARLVDWTISGQKVTLIFEAGNQLFNGLLNLAARPGPRLPEKNSLVNVTGVSVVSELEDTWFYQPRSFLLLLADRADLQVVQAPPWWTPERLWRALAITVVVLLAAAGWAWSLRRQIERKRAVIEQQARHAAALEERSRIARDLHDTLEQGLTGLSLQMKAMETDLDAAPHPVRSRLQQARQMLRQSRALAHNAIRELRSEATASRHEGLTEGLRRVADSWNQSGALRVDIQVAGAPRALAPRLENHLLGIGTEAMTNAVKHGRADAIHVELDFRPAEVALRIRDNGTGFDPRHQLEQPSGCFGLIGMRERAREVGGQIRIVSEPGRGTEIFVAAPCGAGS
jgi:signal transduction histidine kinase